MILKVEVLISFPLGAVCNTNIDLYVYKKLLSLLKNTLCYSKQLKCNECLFNNNCLFYKYTGENFKFYPAILMNIDNFYKTKFINSEEKKFNFYFIGESANYKKFIDLLFEEYMKNKIFDSLYTIKQIKYSVIENNNIDVKEVSIFSIIETLDVKESFISMINYYNNNYLTAFVNEIEDANVIQSNQITNSKNRAWYLNQFEQFHL